MESVKKTKHTMATGKEGCLYSWFPVWFSSVLCPPFLVLRDNHYSEFYIYHFLPFKNELRHINAFLKNVNSVLHILRIYDKSVLL